MSQVILDETQGKSRIYDGASMQLMRDSMVDNFLASKTLHTHGFAKHVIDSGVTNAGMYLEQQLTYIIKKVAMRKYPNTPSLSIFSVNNEGALEKILLKRIRSSSGEHLREHENKSNPNKGVITVAYDATGMKIEDFEASSFYKEMDLLRSAMFGDALDAAVMEAHDRSYKTKIDSIAMLGMQTDAGTQLVYGLLNRTDVNSNLTANVTAAFSTATGVQMYNDIAALVAAQQGAVGGNQEMWVNCLVTSPFVLSKLYTTVYAATATTWMTVANMIETNLGITKANMYATNHAIGLDAVGTKDRLCLFNNSADFMELHIPQPLKYSEILKQKFSYTFDSMFRPAGLNIIEQLTFAYLKGC
jgi:hypothetical protein